MKSDKERIQELDHLMKKRIYYEDCKDKAKDFLFVGPLGDQLSLSDFRGEIVKLIDEALKDIDKILFSLLKE